MTMVCLIQHGKSLPKEIDPNKRLSEEGIKETHQMADFLRRNKIHVNRIVHSGKYRAKMTAEIIGRNLDIDNISEEPGLAPLDDPKPWVDKLNELNEDIIIVGHLPHLSVLTSLLLNINTEIIEFRYSGILCLEKSEDGKWRIKFYVRPDYR